MLPPKPACLVLDFSLVISLDVSAAEVFKEIVSLCSRNSCKCYVAGAEREVMTIRIMQDLENVSWSKTFDEAMTSAEEHVLTLSDIIRTSAVPGFEGSLLAIERQQVRMCLSDKLGTRRQLSEIHRKLVGNSSATRRKLVGNSLVDSYLT